MKIINQLLLFFLLIIIFSCAKEKVEGDKHPEIPKFPEHTNNKITIVPFLESYSFMFYTGNNFFVNNGKSLLIYNKEFNYVKKIKQPVYVSHDGTAYINTYDKYFDLKVVYQFKPPFYKKKKLKLIKFNLINSNKNQIKSNDSIRSLYSKVLKQKSKDSLFNKRRFLDSLLTKDFQSKKAKIMMKMNKLELSKNLICCYRINESLYIFNYPAKEIAINIDLYDISIIDNYCNDYKEIENFYIDPESFDKTVMHNYWTAGGGKFSFGNFIAYGYNYINLKLANETTKFKVPNQSGNSGIYILYKSKERIVLTDESKLYEATLQ